jgi:iron complex outermembrane receptor protein
MTSRAGTRFALTFLSLAGLIEGLTTTPGLAEEAAGLKGQAPAPTPAPAHNKRISLDIKDISLEAMLQLPVQIGSMRKEKASNAPAVLTVLHDSDLENYQYGSLAEALQFVPGFYVLNDYIVPNVGLRGVNGGMGAQSQLIKGMIDGSHAGFRPTGGVFLGTEFMPLEAIKRVEILRGPGSALYGANAFLGVLNVIPKSASDFGPGHVRLSFSHLENWGRPGEQLSLTTYGTPLGIDSVLALTLRRAFRDGLKLPTSSPYYENYQTTLESLAPRDDEDYMGTAFGRFSREGERLGTLTLDGGCQFFKRTANFALDSSPLQGGTISLVNGFSTLHYEKQLRPALTLKAFSSLSGGQPTPLDKPIDGHKPSYNYLKRTLGYWSLENRAELSWDLETVLPWPSSLSIGADYLYDHEEGPSLKGHNRQTGEMIDITPRPTSIIFHDIGGFGEASLTLFNHLSLTGGVRFEHHSQYKNQANYRAALVADYTPVVIKALYGSSFKAAPVSLLYARPVVLGGPEANPDLRPQHAQTAELHGTVLPRDWLSLAASAYYTYIDNLAQINTQSFIPKAENSLRVSVWGAELELHLRGPIPALEAFATLSYASARRESQSAMAQRQESQTSLYPEWMASLGALFTWSRAHLQFMTLARAASQRRADDSNIIKNGSPYELPSYALLSLGVRTVDLSLLDDLPTTLSLKLNNVFNTAYSDPGFLGIDVPGERWNLALTLAQTL